MWLVREMVRNNIAGVDNLCWNLMRNAAGGDISPTNITLIEYLLDLYQDHRYVSYKNLIFNFTFNSIWMLFSENG